MSAALRRALLLLAALCSWPVGARAETPRLKLHLTCPQTCFEDYLRQELSYFDLVRDRHQSDLTLLIVRQKAASGGERISVQVLRAGGPVNERVALTQPATPPEQVRREVLAAALATLFEASAGTPHQRAFELSLPQRLDGSLSRLADPWDHWVIAPELKG